jgi:diguanylate cyclase (GGDEF)-like protein
MGASPRGASHEDRKLIKMLGSELGGPLRIGALIEQTRQVAMTDALTGVMNRRAFLEAMDRERSRVKRFGHALSILLLDLDHFKQVNDTRGHGVGDEVLKGLSGVLRKMARKADLVARWGGEEFIVGLPETAEAGARVAAERLRRAISDTLYSVPGGEAVSATASIGMATIQADESVDELIARADQAMYLAKARGRNRVEGTEAKERTTVAAAAPRTPATRRRLS